MQRLSGMTRAFRASFSDHAYLLAQTSNMTTEILDTLEATAAASVTIQQSFVSRNTVSGWWLYLACPAVSIVMGSYGLPPSILRNFGLFAFGELMGLFFSYASHLGHAAAMVSVLSGAYSNGTALGL